MCKISVIATVYKMELYIDRFLNSIEKQLLDDFEVILIDDGSPDRCPVKLDEFARNNTYCRVIHQQNQGVCAARNNGIQHAKGEYVFIVDSDDWLADNALTNLWNAAQETNADIVYGQTYIEYENKTVLEKPFPHSFVTEDRRSIKEIHCALNNNNLIKTNCPDFCYISYLGGAPWRAMVRKSIIIDNSIKYDTSLTLGEDILFWQNVYDHVKRVTYMETPIYHYRFVRNSLSHGYKKDLLQIYDRVFNAEESYLTTTNKDRDHWEAYYFRVIIYIRQAVFYLFLNSENVKEGNYTQFLNLLKNSPYRTAIREVNLNKLVKNTTKLPVFLLKTKQYWLYWHLLMINEKRRKHRSKG